jgi:hypothetical protein
MPFDGDVNGFSSADESPALGLLKEVRSRMAEPEKWTQGAMSHSVTKAHCLVGWFHHIGSKERSLSQLQIDAILADTVYRHLPLRYRYLKVLGILLSSDETMRTKIALFNDSRSHDEVLALLDRAIAYEQRHAAKEMQHAV